MSKLRHIKSENRAIASRLIQSEPILMNISIIIDRECNIQEHPLQTDMEIDSSIRPRNPSWTFNHGPRVPSRVQIRERPVIILQPNHDVVKPRITGSLNFSLHEPRKLSGEGVTGYYSR